MKSAAALRRREHRFTAEAGSGAPEAPRKTMAHPERVVLGGDPTEHLVRLCRRRLAAGLALTEPQLSALAAAGLRPASLGPIERAAAAVPAVYRERVDSAASSSASAAPASIEGLLKKRRKAADFEPKTSNASPKHPRKRSSSRKAHGESDD